MNTVMQRLDWGWRKTLLALWQYQNPYWRLFTMGVILLGANLVFDIGLGLIQGPFFNQMKPGHTHQLMQLIWISFSVGLGLTALSAVQHYCRYVASAYADRRLAMDLLTKVTRLPFTTLQRNHSADFVSRIVNDTGLANNALSSLVYDVLYQVLLGAVAFYYLSRINGVAAVVSVLVGPALFLLGRFFDGRIRAVSEDIQRQDAQIRSKIQECVQNMSAVRAYSLEEKTIRDYARSKQVQNKFTLRRTIFQSSMWQFIMIAQGGVQVVAAFLIAMNALRGHISPGQVMTFVFLMSNVQTPFMRMSQVWNGIQQSLGAAERVFQVAQMPEEQTEEKGSTAIPMTDARTDLPAIAVKDVRLMVPDATNDERPVNLIEGMNLVVHGGETVAIVGPSGSGKTSFARLLCGLYSPSEGEVRITGYHSIQEMQQARAQIAYVPQNPYLFSLSIRDNIAIGRPNCTEQDIVEAAKAASAHDFIAELPEGYDTLIGEQGLRLSGGQRQRIAMARAFLQNTPIIVLDEPTSALDNETERAIQTALERMATKRTLVIIAHRLTTVRNADRIVVMERGKVKESGSHSALLRENGLYARLVALQNT